MKITITDSKEKRLTSIEVPDSYIHHPDVLRAYLKRAIEDAAAEKEGRVAKTDFSRTV